MSTLVNNQWISLTEYSNKYKVSISTLRRRIRKGFLNVRLESGKYFLKDEDFEKINSKYSSSLSGPHLPLPALKPPPSSPVLQDLSAEEREKKGDSGRGHQEEMDKIYTALQKNGTLLHQLLHSQKNLQTKTHEKDKILYQMQNQLADLKTLVALLEKENRELKSLLYQEKEMEDWLHGGPEHISP